jgi:hypothetical protein
LQHRAIAYSPTIIPTMAQKWNEHNLLRLLLLAINDFQGNFTELASEWAKRYRMVTVTSVLLPRFFF